MEKEYLLSDANTELIGKRAEIKKPLNYACFLWGRQGTIQDVCGCIFLKFDELAYRHKEDTMPMSGVYLTPNSFKIIQKSE